MYVFIKSRLAKMAVTSAVIFMATLIGGEAMAYEFEIKLSKDRNIASGNEALKEGDVDRAVASFSRALESDLTERQAFLAHNGLCVAYNKQEEYFRALDHCDQAIALRKAYFGGYVNRGNVYLSLEQYDEAIVNYEKAKELVPESFIPTRNIEIANMRREDSTPSHPMPPELMFDSCDQKPSSRLIAMN